MNPTNGTTPPVSWEHVQSALAEVARIIGEESEKRSRESAEVVSELRADISRVGERVDAMAKVLQRISDRLDRVMNAPTVPPPPPPTDHAPLED